MKFCDRAMLRLRRMYSPADALHNIFAIVKCKAAQEGGRVPLSQLFLPPRSHSGKSEVRDDASKASFCLLM